MASSPWAITVPVKSPVAARLVTIRMLSTFDFNVSTAACFSSKTRLRLSIIICRLVANSPIAPSPLKPIFTLKSPSVTFFMTACKLSTFSCKSIVSVCSRAFTAFTLAAMVLKASPKRPSSS